MYESQKLKGLSDHAESVMHPTLTDLLKGAIITVNRVTSFHQAVEQIVSLLRTYTACDAVGVRMRSGEDFPFYAHTGYPDNFFPHGNSLFIRDSYGALCQNEHGKPALKCLCGAVLAGAKSGTAIPLTPAGSFWTNSLSALLASTDNVPAGFGPGSTCFTSGFCSIAIIPLRARRHTIGLLHLCFRQENAITPELVNILESIALLLGGAYEHLYELQRLRDDENKYRELVEGLNEIVFSINLDGIITYISPVVHTLLGYTAGELIGQHFSDFIFSPESNAAIWEHAFKSAQPQNELQIQHKDGTLIWVHISNLPVFEDGRVTGIRGIMVDINRRKIAEQEYHRLFNEMLNGFALHEIICDSCGKPVDYRFLAVNPAFERMTGLIGKDIVGKTVLEVLPNTETCWIEIYGKVAITGRSINFENYSTSLNKHFSVTAFPHGDNQFACIFNDISDRVHAERELRASEALHKSFLDTMPLPVFVKDMSGRYTRVNRALCTFFNKPEEYFIGKSAFELFPPDLVELYEQKDREIKLTQQPKIYESIVVDFDQTPHNVIFHKAALLDESGNITGIIGAIMDITERKRAAKALHDSEERMTLALQGADLGMWDWNIATGTMAINERWASMLGYRKEEIPPHISTLERLVHPDDFGRVQNAVQAHLGGKTAQYESEHRLRHKSGNWIWVVDKGRVIKRDSDGTPLRACGTHLDITDRKNLEMEASLRREQLIHADKLSTIGTLVACVMHEVNNPVGVLSLNVPTLRTVWEHIQPIMDEIAQQREGFCVGNTPYQKIRAHIPQLLEGISGSCERITRIIKSLKDFARPETAESKQEVRLNDLTKGAARFLEHHLQKSTRNFSMTLEEELPVIPVGFPGRIEQVIINILMNASQALTDPQQPIRVATGFDQDSGCVFVEVHDGGCGISSANLEKISTPFFTTKRAVGGSGLGLSICNSILKEHGGRLEITSSEGKGTTVRIILPLEHASMRN